MKLNVVAIDDHEIALLGLGQLLAAAEEIDLVGTYNTVGEVLSFIKGPAKPTVDVVLLDLRLADASDPFVNATQLQEAGVRVLVYSSLESPFLIRRALHAGVAGLVEKSSRCEDLVTAIQMAAQGQIYATADWAGIIDSDPVLHAVNLSQRQREVLELYAMGESAKRVARLTGLSTDTVQDYLGRIRSKYALAGRPANTKVDLFRRAQEDGFIPGPREG
ncbi:response regulator transcription factor [Corynebacterium alimapuense]|uniref:Helix-turn-helix transcriptional regulator n=1 Tax=Corynebacterium alimapuense TaxID=1576874 RepID=A0A3M8K6N5_9CORY|nr:response regulator transcription factor [Corynebacterium alimapuense]RNE48415.1 helix-turn-helix transcriptional regulator [Corynebacterium alimapuense]